MMYGIVKVTEEGLEQTYVLPEEAFRAILRDIKRNSVDLQPPKASSGSDSRRTQRTR